MKFEFEIPDQVVAEDPHYYQYAKAIQMMASRMSVSHYRYGNMADAYPHSSKAINNVDKRVEMYKESGNIEDMLDAANFCIIEALFPSHPKAHFRARSTGETGRVYGGIEDDGAN